MVKKCKNPQLMRVYLPMAEDMRRDLRSSHLSLIHKNARISSLFFPILPVSFTLCGHLCGHEFEQLVPCQRNKMYLEKQQRKHYLVRQFVFYSQSIHVLHNPIEIIVKLTDNKSMRFTRGSN